MPMNRLAHMSGERGATIVMVALAMAALLSVVALAVDVGMLLTAKTEAQRTADSAAMAGAGTLIFFPDGDTEARAEAQRFGEMNAVQGVVDIDPAADVDVDLVNKRVTVRVHRDDVRGGPVGTWFARVFGINSANIGADATAEVKPAGSAVCVMPFAVPDEFYDVDGDGIFEPEDGDAYDPAIHGYGSDWRNPGSPGDDGQGYEYDFGRQMVIKGGGPGAAGGGGGSGGGGPGGGGSQPGTGPSWYYPWDIPQVPGGNCAGGPGGQGAQCYQWAIENCHPSVISLGEEYMVANGGMTGPTRTGINNVIDEDPFASWDDGDNEVTGSAWDPWSGSPRVRIVPVYDPSREFDPGKKPVVFSNFIAMFVEGVQGGGTFQTVTARVLYASGIFGGEITGPANLAVQLIE